MGLHGGWGFGPSVCDGFSSNVNYISCYAVNFISLYVTLRHHDAVIAMMFINLSGDIVYPDSSNDTMRMYKLLAINDHDDEMSVFVWVRVIEDTAR